ncbi:site-specific integrase [Streptomyces sp. NPDC059152]|uniref:site-specific integrase n=1 Tax=Streptomyces sp. NPDC059152 TaxID=3346742 RepID=UPI00369F8FDE
MPSGIRCWTVVDDELALIHDADRFLRELRLARGRAESTTKAYAEGLALFLHWCERGGRDWRTAAEDMGLIMLLLSRVGLRSPGCTAAICTC